MKSPIVATTDPRPFDACEDVPLDVLQRLGLALTPPEHEDGLRCHFDAGNYQLAVEPIVWRTYQESLPADAIETTGQGRRAAQYWAMKPLRGDPAGAVLLDDRFQPRGRLHVHQSAAGQRPRALLQVLDG